MSYVAPASVTRRSWQLEKLGQTIRSSANLVASVLAGKNSHSRMSARRTTRV
jgi:hypothetical protein